MRGEIYDGKSALQETEVKPRKRRDTQDRDERMRRGRLKREYQKQELARKKKFARKVEFKDFLRDDGDENDTGNQVEGENRESMKKRQKKDPYIKSSRSVYDRFSSMLSRGKDTYTINDDDEEEDSRSKYDRTEDSTGIENTTDDQMDITEKKKKKSFFDPDEIVSDQEGESGDDEDNDDDADRDDNETASAPKNFQWFFNSLSSETSDRSSSVGKKMKYEKSLIPSSGDKVYHHIQPSLEIPCDVKTLADLPGLPKLWKSRSSLKLPLVGKEKYHLFLCHSLFIIILHLIYLLLDLVVFSHCLFVFS